MTLGEIKKESDKYEEAMKKGAESNAELHKAMNTHISHLKMLCLPPEELAKALPSVSPSGSKCYHVGRGGVGKDKRQYLRKKSIR